MFEVLAASRHRSISGFRLPNLYPKQPAPYSVYRANSVSCIPASSPSATIRV